MNLSYWEKQSFLANIDIAIIGSGIVGLSAAIELKEKFPEKSIVILEKGFLPAGASTKNAGFACFGSVSELLADLAEQTETEVFQLVEQRWKGLLKLRKRIGDKQLGYHNWSGYELFKPTDQKLFTQCINVLEHFNQIVQQITGTPNTYQIADHKIGKFGFSGVEHLIENSQEGQINTGAMMAALLEIAQQLDIKLYNGFDVDTIVQEENKAIIFNLNQNAISAKQIIVATNGFAKKILPIEAINPARNQVLVTSAINNLNIKGTFHYDEGYIYFRNVGNRVLLGGGRNRAMEEETTSNFGLTDTIKNYLLNFLQETILPNTEFVIEHEWSGIMGIGNNKTPIIKKISPNIYASIRLGGMGVAIGSLVGQAIADLVIEDIS